MDTFAVNAQRRHEFGTAASRRLRRAGMVPATLYGRGGDPIPLSINAHELKHHLEHEAFYSHILNITLNGSTERAVLRDIQRHPYKQQIIHIDFLRVSEDQEIKVHVPLHFLNEENCIGVKQQGGRINHLQTEVEVSCLPRHLPEYIEVDIAGLELGHSLHLSSIPLPPHVKILALAQGEEHDVAIVNIFMPRVAAEEAATEQAAAAGDDATAAEGSDGKKAGESKSS